MKPYVEPKLEIMPSGMEKCSWWDAYRLGKVGYAEYWHRSRGLPQNTALPAIYTRYVCIKKIVYPWEAKKFIALFRKKYALNMPREIWRPQMLGSYGYMDENVFRVVDLYEGILDGEPPSDPPKDLDKHFLDRSAQMFRKIEAVSKHTAFVKEDFKLKHTQFIG